MGGGDRGGFAPFPPTPPAPRAAPPAGTTAPSGGRRRNGRLLLLPRGPRVRSPGPAKAARSGRDARLFICQRFDQKTHPQNPKAKKPKKRELTNTGVVGGKPAAGREDGHGRSAGGFSVAGRPLPKFRAGRTSQSPGVGAAHDVRQPRGCLKNTFLPAFSPLSLLRRTFCHLDIYAALRARTGVLIILYLFVIAES